MDVEYNDEERFVECFNVNAKVTEGNSVEVVASVQAVLLQRPSGSFFEQADAVSGELQLLSIIFCEPNGVASRVNHPRLQGDPSVHRGGFFHIDQVEIKPSHKGHDLGLRVLHEVLVIMKDKWSLAVMLPVSLCARWCQWKENSRQMWPEHDNPTPVQLADAKRNDVLIQKQFGRMGFVQAMMSSSEGSKAWFLTSTMYFSASDDSTQAPISRWLSKEQAAQIDIYQPPQKHEPTGLDKELHDFIGLIRDPRSRSVSVSMLMVGAGAPPAAGALETKIRDIATIERLVNGGASIHDSRALFVAAALSLEDPYPLQTLLRLDGDVNLPDENGSRPLHVAASAMKPRNVEFLVNVAGADTGLTDSDGITPLQSLQEVIRGIGDMNAAFDFSGMPPREIDIMPRVQCLVALMPERMRSSLIDGWMSPRIRLILTITAELEGDDLCESQFTAYCPLPLSECYEWGGISRIDYIPPASISHNMEGLYMSFADGWRQLFETMAQILRDGRTPTVRRIQEYTESGVVPSVDTRKYHHFLQKGGRVEFAVDALIRISRNVTVDGDDGWEYGTFQDDIEALPANTMDSAFDVARFMCINRGGGELQTCGPYRREQGTYDDDDDDDNDDNAGDY
jgi:hypothetical protein